MLGATRESARIGHNGCVCCETRVARACVPGPDFHAACCTPRGPPARGGVTWRQRTARAAWRTTVCALRVALRAATRLAGQRAHDGQRRHVERHARALHQLGLVQLGAAAHHVARPARRLHDDCAAGKSGHASRRRSAVCHAARLQSRAWAAAGRAQRSSSSWRSTSPMIWPTLWSALRSSSVLSNSLRLFLTSSRRARTRASSSCAARRRVSSSN
jgi:hypothetical protein